MGMFDYITCEAPLPLTKTLAKQFKDVDFTKVDFQTKDLDNFLSRYIINKKNYICQEIVHRKQIKKNKPKDHKGFWFPYEFEETGRDVIKIKHTGDVNFYSHIPDNKGDEYWLEFNATFFKGKLIEIKFIKKDLFRTKKRIEEDNQYIKDMFETDAKKIGTRIRKFLNKNTFGGYKKFKNFLSSSFYKLGGVMYKIQWFVVRYL